MKILVSVIAFVLVLGSAAYAQSEEAELFKKPRQVTLAGIIVGPMNIQFQVLGIAGCSNNTKALYQVKIEGAGSEKALTLMQTKGERCAIYQPFGDTITFSYKELGLNADDQISIRNEIEVPVVKVIRYAVQ